MSPQRPRRMLLLTTSLAAIALAGCASAAEPRWTEPPAAQAPVAPAPVAAAVAAAVPAMHHGAVAAVTHMSDRAVSAVAPAAAAPTAAPAAEGAPVHLDLTIVTGDMIDKTEYPALIPSDFVLPANSTVVVTITNFDDATPLPKDMVSYATAQGLVGGTFTVTPIDPKSPNGSAGPTTTRSSLNPNDVSHTITVPGLGINVPIAAQARVTFTIHTGAAGRYEWHCMDPCGAGPTGWGTAMAARRGYMEGTITVA